MVLNDQRIRYLLWKEVAERSPSAIVGFILASFFTFFHSFNLVQFNPLIKAASIVVLIANISRFIIAKKITASKELSSNHVTKMKVSIWVNSLAWGVIFSFSSYELNFIGFNFILVLTLLVGFASSSLLTLGYDKSIYLPFQVLTILPPLALLLYQAYSGQFPDAGYLSMLFFIFFIYQMKQFRTFQHQMLEKLGYQIELEKSLKEVKESKEAFMEQTAKMAHASQITALGDMAGGLAHEVNNSLQVIMVSTQQIQRELDKSSETSDQIKNKFQQTKLAIQKIKSVIDGLKYFSLQMDPEQKEDVPLKEIIDRTLNYTFELIKAHGITLKLTEIPDVKIRCHAFQITHILFNLIKNADDALVNSSKERWIDISFEMKGECLFIKVKNGGEKIAKNDQGKLFQPFFSTKDINQGSGLSLSISRGIALDHRGDLSFDPTERFTTFVLKLPVST